MPGTRARLGLGDDQVERAAWTVIGEVRVGGARAIGLAVATAWNSKLPLVPWRLPLVPALLDRAYEAIADRRHRLPGDEPWCDAHPGSCADG